MGRPWGRLRHMSTSAHALGHAGGRPVGERLGKDLPTAAHAKYAWSLGIRPSFVCLSISRVLTALGALILLTGVSSLAVDVTMLGTSYLVVAVCCRMAVTGTS